MGKGYGGRKGHLGIRYWVFMIGGGLVAVPLVVIGYWGCHWLLWLSLVIIVVIR